MTESQQGSLGGIISCGLLGGLFVTLKLCHVIGWSWWHVTMPFWAPFAIPALIVIGGFMMLSITSLVTTMVDKAMEVFD